MKYLITISIILVSLLLCGMFVKQNAWEQEWIILSMYNGPQVRVRKADIEAYKYFPKYAYTDVYLHGNTLEVRDTPEEIDFLMGRN